MNPLKDSSFFVRSTMWFLVAVISLSFYVLFLSWMGYSSQAYEIASIFSYWGPPVILVYTAGASGYFFLRFSFVISTFFMEPKKNWKLMMEAFHAIRSGS